MGISLLVFGWILSLLICGTLMYYGGKCDGLHEMEKEAFKRGLGTWVHDNPENYLIPWAMRCPSWKWIGGEDCDD